MLISGTAPECTGIKRFPRVWDVGRVAHRELDELRLVLFTLFDRWRWQASGNAARNPEPKRLMRALADEGGAVVYRNGHSVADDEDLLALMREAGCAEVLVGLESDGRSVRTAPRATGRQPRPD
jgi:hypothetical protein